MSDPASAMRFDVTIDGVDLGTFMSLEGLDAVFDVKVYDEGGENGYQHHLLGRVHYSNLNLSRPVDSSTRSLTGWFSSFKQGNGAKSHFATVRAFNDNLETVAEWNLVGVSPVRYQGPKFSTDSSRIATETLELAHNGFLS